MGINCPTTIKTVQHEIEDRVERRNIKDFKRRNEEMFAQLEKLQRTLDASLEIQDHQPEIKIPKPLKTAQGEATIIALLSDTHIEETVKPETVNGMNSYTLEIAERRFQSYFVTLLRLIEIEQQATPINHLVLALLGDFISGDIHEELLETCSLTPMDAIIKAEDWLVSGIQYLLDNSGLVITLPCHSGNHARTTKKVRHATEAGHSVEWLLFHHLQRHFKHEKRLTFQISPGYLSYMQIYDKIIAFHHGHNVKYGGGIGGITVPMNKKIAAWNRTRPADIYCAGHFHQVFDGGNFIQNGSMIGYNAFALSIGASYEEPAQVMFAIHSKYGKYLSRTIKFID